MEDVRISLEVKEAIAVTRKLAEVNQLQKELTAMVNSLMKRYKPKGMKYKDFDANEGVLIFEEEIPAGTESET